jgi:hypothetical protein
VVATGLDRKIENLRKGRSIVLERDHTLILGWSETIFTIVNELEIANASEILRPPQRASALERSRRAQ